MNFSDFDDAALLRLVAGRQNDALGELYQRYGRLVFSLAYQTLSDTHLAEEITQDVFTRVWEKANTYDASFAKVSTWLLSITRNRAIDELRRRSVRPEGHSVGWDDLHDGLSAHAEGPETRAELAWEQKMVREALASLPKAQQEALALAYFRGYSHSQIAQALGEPLGTVKTRIRSAMHKLRQILEEQAL